MSDYIKFLAEKCKVFCICIIIKLAIMTIFENTLNS